MVLWYAPSAHSTPTWALTYANCVENFKLIYVYTINSTDSFNTATGTGKVGLISAEDIATEGFKALTSEKPINAPRYIFGPELLSYDEVIASNQFARSALALT